MVEVEFKHNLKFMDRIVKRKIEVEVLKPFIEELEKHMKTDMIRDLLVKVNEKEACIRGKSKTIDKESLIIDSLLEDVNTWGDGDDMLITFIEKTESTLFFNVTQCPYYELYKKLGVERYGTALSCCRDFSFAKGLYKKLELRRTKTLMEGDDHCDFRYVINSDS